MRMHSNFLVCLFGLLFCFSCTSASAQDRLSIERALFMAQIDYDTAHAILIEGCKAKFPESVPQLIESISRWKSANYEAQVELQSYLRRISGIGNQAVTDQFRKVTDRYGYSLLHLSANEFRDACEGAYAGITLQLPQMNFSDVLEKVKASSEFPKQSNPAMQGVVRDKAAQRH